MRTPGFGLSFVSLPPPSTRNGGLMLYRLLCASGPGISAPTSTLIDRNTRGFSSVYARTCGRWGSKIIASLSNNLPVNQKNRNTTKKKPVSLESFAQGEVLCSLNTQRPSVYEGRGFQCATPRIEIYYKVRRLSSTFYTAQQCSVCVEDI